MPVRKVWDHAIDLKEDFKTSKAKVLATGITPRVSIKPTT